MFPNFSTSFLLSKSSDFIVTNSFESLSPLSSGSCSSSPGPPQLSSSPLRHTSPSRQKKRKLKVISLNCNGLKGSAKKLEFHALIDLHQPDVILGCESKLDPTIPSYSVFPNTYEIFRKDQSLFGGGIFIAVRNDLIAVEEGRLDVDSEIITVSVQFEKSKKFFVSSYYRPPSADRDTLDLLNDAIGKLFNTRSCSPT